MTYEEATRLVHEAMLSVDPDYVPKPNRIGGTGVRVDQRGQRFDVMFSGADRLFDEFNVAIRAALGPAVGTVTEAGSARSSTMPTINNYGPIGAQQFGHYSTAHISQSIIIDQRSIERAVHIVRTHLAEFPDADREEAEHHLETIEEELRTPTPRPSRLRGALTALRRLTPLIGTAAKAVIEAALEAAMKGLLSAHGH